MRRFVFVVLVGLLALPASASAAIRITRIYYNPPGADTGSANSLKAEWIAVRNTGSRARQLQGWRILDSSGHRYRIGSFRLPARTTFKLHTGSGSDSFPSHLYWNLDKYVWNNDGDTARLKNSSGSLVDRCHYSGGGTSVTC